VSIVLVLFLSFLFEIWEFTCVSKTCAPVLLKLVEGDGILWHEQWPLISECLSPRNCNSAHLLQTQAELITIYLIESS
jgi:hypothetical protein